jgi:hypothetical protein
MVTVAPAPARIEPRPKPIGGTGGGTLLGTGFQRETNAEARDDKWWGTTTSVGLASQMLTDPHVRQAVEARVSPLVGARWGIDPGEDSPLGHEVADFVRYNLLERIDFRALIRRMALDYNCTGVSVHEWTDELAPVPRSRFGRLPGGLGLVLRGVHHRPRWSIAY